MLCGLGFWVQGLGSKAFFVGGVYCVLVGFARVFHCCFAGPGKATEGFYESFIRVVEVQHRLQRSGSEVQGVLGGSWVAISGVISPLIEVITTFILLITLLITAHEPPSRVYAMRGKIPTRGSGFRT